jgi:hypothetical protein
MQNHPVASAAVGAAVVGTAIFAPEALPVLGRVGAKVLPRLGIACAFLCPEGEEDGPKVLNPPINNIANELGHVVERHGFGTAANNVSIFNEGENIPGLIRSGTQQPMFLQDNTNNFARIFDVGRNIGIERATGGQTTIMTIITNQNNELITSFPGRP